MERALCDGCLEPHELLHERRATLRLGEYEGRDMDVTLRLCPPCIEISLLYVAVKAEAVRKRSK